MKRLLKTVSFYTLQVLAAFAILEGVSRLLPVASPPPLQPVSAAAPIAHFERNVDYVYSAGWNFAIRSHKHTNNFGFSNVADYRRWDRTPLLMVIGDSFVEAHEVDAGKSAAELLHAGLGGAGRVYSIGLSGGALPQYLASAAYACATFHPQALAFVIIGNDFHESLLKYNVEPQLHHFDDQGRLTLAGYELPLPKRILRHSAFVRYVMYNAMTGARLEQIRNRLRGAHAAASLQATSEEQLLRDSRQAVDWFLEQLPSRCKVDPRNVLFVLDAVRPEIYSAATLPQAIDGFHGKMRAYLAAEAGRRGHQVLDMQPVFIARHEQDGSRFEFPTDKHWNALGHRLVADEMRRSAMFAGLFGAGLPAVASRSE